MGNCFFRDKDIYIKYETYIYCNKCLSKIKYGDEYIIINIYRKSMFFCSRNCYINFID